MKVTKKLLVLLFALALIVAACGDDEGGDDGTTTAAPPATTAAPGTTAAPTTMGPTTTIAPPAEEIATDIGVDDTEIRIGLLADLTGVFRGLTVDIVDAQLAYWDIVNANGGIAGREVVPIVEDTVYQVDTHEEKYLKIVDDVVAFSNSTGSPHTAGILDNMVEDNVMAIPLSWYSGWADSDFDQGLAFEQGTNYCLEGMNMIEYVGGVVGESKGSAPTVAIVTRPGDYGEDAAAGAVYAANQLGYEVVYDGIGDIVRDSAGNFDPTTIVTNILTQNPDLVFVTGAPSELGPIMGGAVAQGYQGQWTGSGPSYDFRLLDSELAPALSAFYWISDYYTQWGTDVPGMNEVVEGLTAAYPDRRPSNAFIIGWTEAKQMEQILRLAAANGDLTRQGVIDAANSIELITLDGAGPDLTYVGEPNDYVIRTTNIFRPDAEAYAAAGGAEQKLSDGVGTAGARLEEENYVGSLASAFEFTGACWTEADGDVINN
jgi:ABC-type branched-subunit amino acid transport system substrate-binding protein